MKAAIYSQYLDTLGGGERYILGIARALSENGFDVDIEWSSKTVNPKKIWQTQAKSKKEVNAINSKDFEKRFGISFDHISFVEDINRGDGYDLCFWVSDGSIPALKSRRNFLHFQVPFRNVNGKSLINKVKLMRIKEIICNSNFTKSVIDEEFGVKSVVLYPPVDVEKFKPKRKQNIILYVGRFSQLLQSKGQDVLIENFKKLVKSGIKDWKLILAGGAEVGADKYLKKLKKLSKGYKVEIVESPSFKEIRDLYGVAKIFWSASGFGINEMLEPMKVEHFGITVVEAMSAGALPIVYAAGGHKEIIKPGKNGFLWTNESDLIEITSKLIQDEKLLRSFKSKMQESSKKYSHENFEENFLKLI